MFPSFDVLRRFSEFKREMAGKDPEAIVKELLESGKMSQEQFEQLKKQADQLASILK